MTTHEWIVVTCKYMHTFHATHVQLVLISASPINEAQRDTDYLLLDPYVAMEVCQAIQLV